MRGALVVVLLLLAGGNAAQAGARQELSLRIGGLGPDERVTAVHLEWRGARAVALPRVADGWTMRLDNPGSWRGRYDASIVVGAAALDGAGLVDLLRVERYPQAAEIPFRLHGSVTIGDYSGSGREARRHVLGADEFELRDAP